MNGNGTNLAQRRAWFRYFPEGTLEFLLVTRVLALLLLAGLTVVRGSQRPAILSVLGGLVLVDYLLILWWGIQLVIDLDDLTASGSMNDAMARKRRLAAFLVAMLPAIFVTLFLTPVLEFAITNPVHRERLAHIFKPVMGVGYLILLIFAWRRLSAIRLGGGTWVVLFLIPGLHFFALHRLMSQWQRRLDQRLQAAQIKAEPAAKGLLHFTDATWCAGMLAIGLLVVMSVYEDATWVNRLFTVAYFTAAALMALFATAEVALMENVQRRYLAALQVEQAN